LTVRVTHMGDETSLSTLARALGVSRQVVSRNIGRRLVRSVTRDANGRPTVVNLEDARREWESSRSKLAPPKRNGADVGPPKWDLYLGTITPETASGPFDVGDIVISLVNEGSSEIHAGVALSPAAALDVAEAIRRLAGQPRVNGHVLG